MIIGITGGIGSGKSVVSKYLSDRGEHVICADEVSRQVVRNGGKGNIAIRRTFGDAFFFADNMVNRKKLAEHVFSNKEKLVLLNELLHPIIDEYIFTKVDRLEGRVFIDAALLIQSGMYKKTDYLWLVIADLETRIQRVMKRDGLSYGEVKQRMDSQMSDQDMLPYAQEVIDNSDSIGNLHNEIERLLNKPKYIEEII